MKLIEKIHTARSDAIARTPDASFTVPITKADDTRQLVFGWSNVVITKDGRTVTDSQGDEIAIEDLEDAAYVFNLAYREGDVMHTEEVAAQLVESLVITDDKLRAFATDPESGAVNEGAYEKLSKIFPRGWWAGWYVPDPELYAKCKPGPDQVFKMFSIGGIGVRESADVLKAAPDESYDAKSDRVRSSFRELVEEGGTNNGLVMSVPSYDCWVSEVYPDYVIVHAGDDYFKVPYTEDDALEITFDLTNSTEVVRQWVEIGSDVEDLIEDMGLPEEVVAGA